MGRIVAIDYGKKRTGIAVTDTLKITANPLDTIPTEELFTFLNSYIDTENVESIVVGMPRKPDNSATHMTQDAINLIQVLKEKYPDISVFEEDETTYITYGADDSVKKPVIYSELEETIVSLFPDKVSFSYKPTRVVNARNGSNDLEMHSVDVDKDLLESIGDLAEIGLLSELEIKLEELKTCNETLAAHFYTLVSEYKLDEVANSARRLIDNA